jgi:hypothetical protein
LEVRGPVALHEIACQSLMLPTNEEKRWMVGWCNIQHETKVYATHNKSNHT